MNRTQTFLLILLVLMAILAMIGFDYYDGVCDCHCDYQAFHRENWGLLCRLIGEPAGIIGLASVFMGAFGFVLISGQMTQANEAIRLSEEANRVARDASRAAKRSARQAKRSVDAYMANERGRLSLYGQTMETSILTRVTFSFKNTGKRQILLRNSAFYLLVLHEAPRNEWSEHLTIDDCATWRTVEPDKQVTTGEELCKVRLIDRKAVDLTREEQKEYRAFKLFLFVRGWIQYEDSFGQLWQMDVAMNLHPDHQAFIPTEHPELNRERMIQSS